MSGQRRRISGEKPSAGRVTEGTRAWPAALTVIGSSRISLVSVRVPEAVWAGIGIEKKKRSRPRPTNGSGSIQYPARNPAVTPVFVLTSKIVALTVAPVSSRPLTLRSADLVHAAAPVDVEGPFRFGGRSRPRDGHERSREERHPPRSHATCRTCRARSPAPACR